MMHSADSDPAPAPAEPVSGPNYVRYWNAWIALLVITAAMLFVSAPGLIVVGMCAKATIIAAWFMHLNRERLDFVLYVVVSIVFLSAILYGLILPDGRVM